MGREGVQATSERAVAASDRDTFAEFVRPHWGIMASLARRLTQSDGDDVLQDALAAAWRKRAQFDPDRGTPRNWLLAIVADQAAKGRRRIRPVTELVDVAEIERDRDVDVDLRAALRQLTDRQRTAVTLHYYLGVPIADAAAVLGCAPGTVKSTLSDARARLRTLLGEDYR
jgi:RNA polymerase sigma-70 factor (ECF subfamily)